MSFQHPTVGHLCALLATLPLAYAGRSRAGDEGTGPSTLAKLRTEAEAMGPLLTSQLAKEFVAATRDLPKIEPRVAYFDESTRTYYTKVEVEALAADERERLKEKALDEEAYYFTKYGTPLAYARPLELLAQHGFESVDGKRILDFGYGTVGHLRLMATLGADATGVDVDSFLTALYHRPEDQGDVTGRDGKHGRVRLVQGQWPADEATKAAVGDGYDLFLSKNTLKNGYLHPERPVNPRMLVHLGVENEAFVRAVFQVLKPGGRLMIYNLCPAPAPPDKPYIPWADGRCPFPKTMWESAGFRVVAFDVDDTKAARAMAHALGWDQGEEAMDLEKDLFAHYSLMEKPK